MSSIETLKNVKIMPKSPLVIKLHEVIYQIFIYNYIFFDLGKMNNDLVVPFEGHTIYYCLILRINYVIKMLKNDKLRNEKVEVNIKKRLSDFKNANMQLLFHIVTLCTDEEGNLDLSDRKILQTKIFEPIDLNDQNYSIDMDDDFQNTSNIDGTNFKYEKKVPTESSLSLATADTLSTTFGTTTITTEQSEVENKNLFKKEIACIQIPLIQKYYPFVPFELSINDFHLLDTVIECHRKPNPSSIVQAVFSRKRTIENMMVREFLYYDFIFLIVCLLCCAGSRVYFSRRYSKYLANGTRRERL